jgi:prepilin-type N-terminal cleavage/methylation domain-containing protein
MTPRYLRKNCKGFTLVEVLIAAVIALIAVAAGFKVFINHNRNHVIQVGVTNMQQNGRATVDELVHKIRRAGYLLPKGLPALSAWDSNPDTIAISFMIEPVCSATISDPMPQPSSELKCIGSDITCFRDDIWAYIYDPYVDSGEFFFITHIQEDAIHIQHNLAPLTKRYPSGSQIYMIEYRKYYIDDTDTLHPKFMVQGIDSIPEIYADDIADLQFKYKMADGAVLDTIWKDRYVREVMINLVARTAKSDLFLGHYRNDTLTTRVRVRNL